MARIHYLAQLLTLGSCLFAGAAFAQTPIPTVAATATASATPTPTACETVKDCINAAVPTAAASCASSTPACIDKTDKYSVTAGQLAQRSIENAKCSKAKSKFACNACYQRAKDPLRLRFDMKVFHGLLAQAISQIEEERKVTCSPLASKGPKGPHHDGRHNNN